MLPRRTRTNGTLSRVSGHAFDRSPFAAIDEVRREMDRVFDQVLGSWNEPRASWPDVTRATTTATWIPTMDVEDRGEDIRLHVELPGVRAENLNVDVTGDVLTITGERNDEHRETDGVYRLTERRTGRFERRLTLPDYVDVDSISATYEDGVLTVTLPRRAEVSRQRRVEVRSASRQALSGRDGNGADRSNGATGADGSTGRERVTAGSAGEAGATTGTAKA